MIVRTASAADLPAIDKVFRASFCDTFAHLYAPEDLESFLAQFTPGEWEREFDDGAYAFVVGEVGGEVVAFAKLGPAALPVERNGRAIELRQLYVGKAYQGSGVAAALMDWVMAHGRRHGFEELYLTVYTDNFRARRFYERYGFRAVGSYVFMVGNHPDEDFIMVKQL